MAQGKQADHQDIGVTDDGVGEQSAHIKTNVYPSGLSTIPPLGLFDDPRGQVMPMSLVPIPGAIHGFDGDFSQCQGIHPCRVLKS
jgi:hypothetical protein